MEPQERKLLERIEKNVAKIGEDQAYLRGRLEEIHSRTAEIPSLVTKHALTKRSLLTAWVAIIIVCFFHAPAVLAALLALLP